MGKRAEELKETNSGKETGSMRERVGKKGDEGGKERSWKINRCLKQTKKTKEQKDGVNGNTGRANAPLSLSAPPISPISAGRRRRSGKQRERFSF